LVLPDPAPERTRRGAENIRPTPRDADARRRGGLGIESREIKRGRPLPLESELLRDLIIEFVRGSQGLPLGRRGLWLHPPRVSGGLDAPGCLPALQPSSECGSAGSLERPHQRAASPENRPGPHMGRDGARRHRYEDAPRGHLGGRRVDKIAYGLEVVLTL